MDPLGQKARLDLREPRVHLVLPVEWVLPAQWAQPVCREKEAESDKLVQWVNVVHPAMSVNQALWVQWESPVCQDFPAARE